MPAVTYNGPLIKRHRKGKHAQWYMYNENEFTPAELAPYRETMKRLEIRIKPPEITVPSTGRNPQTKAECLADLDRFNGVLTEFKLSPEDRARKLTSENRNVLMPDTKALLNIIDELRAELATTQRDLTLAMTYIETMAA